MSRAQLNSVLRSATRQSFTASAGQTTFTITGGYIAGSIDVYVNGVKMVLGSDYTASNGTSITLVNASAENDTVDVVSGITAMGGIGQVTRQSFIATDAQTVFTVAGGYQPNAIDVFKNGVKLQNGTDVTVTSGTTFTIATPCVVSDIIDVSANQVTGLTGVTNLSTTQDSTTVSVLSDTGSDIVIPAATTSLAGVMTAADKVSLRNYGMKNRIINGGMDIFQRGTSISSGLNTITYVADRWIAYATGAAVTCVRSAGDGDFQYCLANTGAVGNTNVNFIQRIEAANAYCAVGTVMTVSFRVYSTDATTINYAIDTANTADVFTSTTALVNGAAGSVLAATWKTLSFSFTTNAACKNGFQVTIGLGACGSGIARAITGVQLELGSQATEFEHRSYGTELALCQRYYEKSYDQSAALGSNTASGARSAWCYTTGLALGFYWIVPKRTTPTTHNLYSLTGTVDTTTSTTSGTNIGVSASGMADLSQNGCRYINNSSVNWTANTGIYFHYTVTAEL